MSDEHGWCVLLKHGTRRSTGFFSKEIVEGYEEGRPMNKKKSHNWLKVCSSLLVSALK